MRAEELKGHLDAMLLAALEGGPRHGYAVIEALRQSTGGQLDLPTGTIYPALRRRGRTGTAPARALPDPRLPAGPGRLAAGLDRRRAGGWAGRDAPVSSGP